MFSKSPYFTRIVHVLAPQNDFGMPKITWSNHKSFGIEENAKWDKNVGDLQISNSRM